MVFKIFLQSDHHHKLSINSSSACRDSLKTISTISATPPPNKAHYPPSNTITSSDGVQPGFPPLCGTHNPLQAIHNHKQHIRSGKICADVQRKHEKNRRIQSPEEINADYWRGSRGRRALQGSCCRRENHKEGLIIKVYWGLLFGLLYDGLLNLLLEEFLSYFLGKTRQEFGTFFILEESAANSTQERNSFYYVWEQLRVWGVFQADLQS